MPDAVAHPTPPPRRAAARRARGAVLVGPLLVLAACSADAPATATTTSAATPVTTATPSTSPLPAAAMPTTTGRLVELLGRRLEIGVEVARTKWNTKAPIEDLAREATALDAIARAATDAGVDPDTARRLLQAQIDAGKIVQRSLHETWTAEGRPPFDAVADLTTQLRPQLDAVTAELVAVLAAAGSLPALDATAVGGAEAALVARLDGVGRAADAARTALAPLRGA